MTTNDNRAKEIQHRRLFNRAQERFAAADFSAARRALREIPASHRSADVERLLRLVEERLQEIAGLRRDIESAVERNEWQSLSPKLQRLLELQPGDERANELRHEVEERQYGSVETVSTAPPEIPQTAMQKSQQAKGDAVSISADGSSRHATDRVHPGHPPPLPERFRRNDSSRAPLEPVTVDDFAAKGVWLAVGVSVFVLLTAAVATVLVLLAN